MKRKIVPLQHLGELIHHYKSRNQVIGAAGGCFDMLHVGHVKLLQEAKEYCDILFVCLNSDNSVRKLKGKDRPIVPEEERALLLAALEVVDNVVIFDSTSPEGILEVIQPAFWVKGAEYHDKEMPERETVEKYGGMVISVPDTSGQSTTALYSKMKKAMR